MLLIRFSRKSYNDDLLINKQMYMNNLEFFRDLEKDGQGDDLENCGYNGAYTLYIQDKSTLKWEKLVDHSQDNSPINVNNGIRIFCFFFIDENELGGTHGSDIIDYRISWKTIESFWTDDEDMEMLIFPDTHSLIYQFTTAVKAQGFLCSYGCVLYDQENTTINPKFLDFNKTNPFALAFHKRRIYSDQHEYRFALQISKEQKDACVLELPHFDEVPVKRISLYKGKDIDFRFFKETIDSKDLWHVEVLAQSL